MRFFILSGLLSACSFLLTAQEPAEKLSSVALRNPAHLEVVVQGNNAFSFNLYQQLKGKKGNLFLSPYSIANGFMMLGMAARGDTATEMEKVFGYTMSVAPLNGDLNAILMSNPNASRGASQLSIATAPWIQKGLKLMVSYQQNLKQNFNMELQEVDYIHEPIYAVRLINQWVTDHTKGKIIDLLNSRDVTKNTRLVLTSVIYMQGNWLHPFDPKLTKRAPFHTSAHYTTQVEMMHAFAHYPYMRSQNFSMIELPYVFEGSKGAELVMNVIVPNEVAGLTQVEAELSNESWESWIKQLHMQPVKLSLPLFRVNDRYELNSILNAMGLNKAFTPQADFSGITGETGLFVNSAVHKTFLRLDEKGTEAAAATGISIGLTSIVGAENPIDLVVDRPFIVVISDKKTQSILFIGRIVQP